MKTTAEKIEVMQAFVDGKQIEVKRGLQYPWIDAYVPGWEWVLYNYRIKKQKEKKRISGLSMGNIKLGKSVLRETFTDDSQLIIGKTPEGIYTRCGFLSYQYIMNSEKDIDIDIDGDGNFKLCCQYGKHQS